MTEAEKLEVEQVQVETVQQSAKTRTTVIVVIVLGLLSASGLIVAGIALSRQSAADARRAADIRAKAISDVNDCFQSVDAAPQLLGILGLIDALAMNTIKANVEAIAVSPPNDPLLPVRQQSLNRISPREMQLTKIIRAAKATRKYDEDCLGLAHRLGVKPPRRPHPIHRPKDKGGTR